MRPPRAALERPCDPATACVGDALDEGGADWEVEDSEEVGEEVMGGMEEGVAVEEGGCVVDWAVVGAGDESPP